MLGSGLVRRSIGEMTGLSRAQTTRLVARYTAAGQVRPTAYKRHRFPAAIRAATSNCWPPSTRRTKC